MKIRNGFVSNSSSSSFIIHVSLLPDGALEKLLEHLEEMEERYCSQGISSWGDSDRTYEYDRNYLLIETRNIDQNDKEKIRGLAPNFFKDSFYIDE